MPWLKSWEQAAPGGVTRTFCSGKSLKLEHNKRTQHTLDSGKLSHAAFWAMLEARTYAALGSEREAGCGPRTGALSRRASISVSGHADEIRRSKNKNIKERERKNKPSTRFLTFWRTHVVAHFDVNDVADEDDAGDNDDAQDYWYAAGLGCELCQQRSVYYICLDTHSGFVCLALQHWV